MRLGLAIAVCAGLLMLGPTAQAQYGGPGYGGPGYDQGAHCERMRDRLHEIRYRMQYVQPWERERLEARAYELRERLRSECWGRY